MTQPLVSIVTPSYNQGRFLRRTIESVLGQDYPRVEYFVIDGGSTDEAVDILGSYGKRFHWRSGRDNGQSAAINQGLRQARGEILAYLNSDDVLVPGAVRAVVNHFERNPAWDLLYGNAWHNDESDRILAAYPTAAYSFERLRRDCCICQPAAFWRRGVMDRVGLLDETLHYAMDYDYWMRIDRAGGIIRHVPEFLACSRQGPHTKTSAARGKVFQEILAVSRRHAGQASFSQYYAYWHQRCHVDRAGWQRYLSRLPNFHWWLAAAHQRWHRAGGKAAPFCAEAGRTLGRKLWGAVSRTRKGREACPACPSLARPANQHYDIIAQATTE